MFEDEQAGGSALTGGWMFAHEDVAANNDEIVDAFQYTLDNGGFMVGHMWDAGHGLPKSEWNNSAVNPRFRNASDFVITGLLLAGNASLAEKAAAQHKLTFDIDGKFQKAGPHGCAYVNEVIMRFERPSFRLSDDIANPPVSHRETRFNQTGRITSGAQIIPTFLTSGRSGIQMGFFMPCRRQAQKGGSKSKLTLGSARGCSLRSRIIERASSHGYQRPIMISKN